MRESRRRLGAALAGLAAVIAGAGPARADDLRVGLVVATRVNLGDGAADALAFRLGNALRAKLAVDVIAGQEARRRLPPGGIAEDCVARTDCVRDVATRLDSDELLFLFLVRIGPRLQIDATWASPRTGTVTSRPAVVVEGTGNPEATDRAFASSARALLPGAALRPARAPEPPWPAPEPSDGEQRPDLPAMAAGGQDDISDGMPVPRADGDLRRGRGRHITVPAIVSGSVAAAALATGVGFAVAARQDHDSLEEDGCAREACPGVEARVDRMERRALVADILFAGAGAAAVTGLILYITSDDDEPEPRVRLSAADDSAFVSIGGKF